MTPKELDRANWLVEMGYEKKDVLWDEPHEREFVWGIEDDDEGYTNRRPIWLPDSIQGV